MGKVYSVKESRIFAKAYSRGKTAVTHSVVVYALRAGKALSDKPTTLGLTAGKKLGNAVTRNRSKRLMREAYRAISARVKDGYAIILVARHAACGMKMQQVLRDLEYGLSKLGMLKAL